MPFLETMHTYFRGERLEAIWFIAPIGVLLIAFGVVMLKGDRTGFSLGAAVPAVLFGLVLVGTGIGVATRTPAQVEQLSEAYESDPDAMLADEIPRMENVNALFRTTFVAFGAAIVVGLLLTYVVRSDWAQGLGSALILLGALGLLIDGFASRRAIPYTQALQELEQAPR